MEKAVSFLTQLKTAEIVTMIGIFLTFIVGMINLFYSSKQRFVSSVTKMRGEYLKNIKQYIAGFISECTKVMDVNKSQKDEVDYKKLHKMYNLILLNISDKHPFDIMYQKCLTSIYGKMLSKYPSLAVYEMEELLRISRRLVKMEWEGYKYEIKHGHVATGYAKKKLEKLYLFSETDNDETNKLSTFE